MLYLGKLGKLPKREDTRKRTLKLAEFIDYSALTEDPADSDWSTHTRQYPMFGNDSIGNCTICAAAHLEQDWCALTGRKFGITQDDIDAAYKAVCPEWNKRTGEGDNGADLLTVLNHWRQNGIGPSKIYAFAEVNHQNIAEMKLAARWFIGLYAGIMMPLAWQHMNRWDIPESGMDEGQGVPNTWGGHCVSFNKTNGGGMQAITWGQKQGVTWNGAISYTDQVIACIPMAFAAQESVVPNGLKFSDLQKRLKIITA